jgi:hypothetical protein
MRRLLFISIGILCFLFSFPVYAQENKSLQLRFFDPPITNSPIPTPMPTISGTVAPTAPSEMITPASMPTVTQPSQNLAGKTKQADWVFDDEGRCWSAWAESSCSLLSHEGGDNEIRRDLDGDGKFDISCSLGTGASQSTTVTNLSSTSFQLACERYACADCTTGNGTHAQCDGGIDSSSTRISEVFTITPGCVATCTIQGAYGKCLTASIPTPANPTATVQPVVPTSISTPTPTLPIQPDPPDDEQPIYPLCSQGSGYCSVNYLLKYFPNQTAAQKASIICQRESGSNPQAVNKSCQTGRYYDYSIGLFQINLIAHCSWAIAGNSSFKTCRITDQNALAVCENKYLNPDENIKYAVQLSQNGSNWRHWSTSGICNIQ